MQGPLKTVIRNKTDRMLIYTVFPRIYVQPGGECVLDFDPFTRWKDTYTLESLLVDVRKGNAQIVYMIDPKYATAGSKPDMVMLTAGAEAKASDKPKEAPTKNEDRPKPPQQPEKAGVPFGKLPGEAEEPTPKTGAITDGKSTNPAAQMNAEIINKVADEKVATEVDLSKDATAKAKEAVTLTPINDAEIAEKETEAKAAETPKKRGRKKEVIRL
jgi:hypothetical protein